VNQKHTDLAGIRAQCARELPGRIDDAFTAYRRYIAEPPPGDPKLFSAYQTGAKAALAHIDALTKLARWAEAPEPGVEQPVRDDGESLLAAARAAVAPGNEARDCGENQDEEDEIP
jgi:hypothetical protein